MLSKPYRLKKKEVEMIFREGSGIKEDFLILKILKNKLTGIKFSVIVSLKVSKKTTVRNKIKRRISELLGVKIKNIKRGTRGIILAAPGIEGKDFWEIDEALNRLLERAKLLEVKKNV